MEVEASLGYIMRPWGGLKYTFLQIMANKYIKNYSALIIRRVQSKTTMYYNFISEKGGYTKRKMKLRTRVQTLMLLVGLENGNGIATIEISLMVQMQNRVTI